VDRTSAPSCPVASGRCAVAPSWSIGPCVRVGGARGLGARTKRATRSRDVPRCQRGSQGEPESRARPQGTSIVDERTLDIARYAGHGGVHCSSGGSESLRLVGALLLALLALGGCVRTGSQVAPSPDGTPAEPPAVSTPSDSPLPSLALTPDPSATSTPHASPSPTPDVHADPDLEGYLPATIGGVTMDRASVEASEITATAGGDFFILFSPYEVLAFAHELGVSPDDMTLAITGGRAAGVLMYAYGAPGVPAQRMLDARHAMGGLYMNRTRGLHALRRFGDQPVRRIRPRVGRRLGRHSW
jgi:hypothetical protein